MQTSSDRGLAVIVAADAMPFIVGGVVVVAVVVGVVAVTAISYCRHWCCCCVPALVWSQTAKIMLVVENDFCQRKYQ